MPLAAAVVGASVIGAGASIYSASKSASAAQNTAAMNNALYREIYGQNKELLLPFIQRGGAAGDALSALLGLGGDEAKAKAAYDNWLGSTDYGFKLQSGTDAVQTSKALSGLLKSGSALKATTAYGQNLGASYLGNYEGSLFNLLSSGQSGANALAGQGNTMASGIAGSNDNALAARIGANGQISGSINDLLGNLVGAYGFSKGGGFGSSYGGGSSGPAVGQSGWSVYG